MTIYITEDTFNTETDLTRSNLDEISVTFVTDYHVKLDDFEIKTHAFCSSLNLSKK